MSLLAAGEHHGASVALGPSCPTLTARTRQVWVGFVCVFGWDPLTPWHVSGGGVSFGTSSPVHHLSHPQQTTQKGLIKVADTKLNDSLTCEGQRWGDPGVCRCMQTCRNATKMSREGQSLGISISPGYFFLCPKPRLLQEAVVCED